jgi:hypothetical protein
MFEITLSRQETMFQDIVLPAKTMFSNIVGIIHYLSPSRKSRDKRSVLCISWKPS